jgi:hypothetical protein
MTQADIGGTLQDLPHPKYKDFFEKFAEIESLPIDQWKPAHLIGLFCKLYKQHYNIDYKFKFNSPAPSKCYEVFQIKKLAQGLTSDPIKLKKYIEWAFQEKVKISKKRISSIAFLSHEFMITEYKLKYLSGDLREQKLQRTTMLPVEYLSVINKYGHKISTYGELSFLSQMNNFSTDQMMKELVQLGMDVEAIRRIV